MKEELPNGSNIGNCYPATCYEQQLLNVTCFNYRFTFIGSC